MIKKILKPFPRLEYFARGVHQSYRLAFKSTVADSTPGEHVLPAFRSDSANLSNQEIGPDGLPLPSAEMRHWVAGTDDLPWFLEGGKLGEKTIVDILARQNMKLDQLKEVLDFGCGCGRVIRHLKGYASVKLHGTDINPEAICWCDQNLEFAEFGSNHMAPPLRYRNQSFDFIYAFSVFTHLSGKLQRDWMNEMLRILKPGGYLLVTLHGEYHTSNLTKDQLEAFHNGQMVVVGEDLEGHNFCASFHPEAYVRNVFSEGFEVLEYIPEGALGNPRQDAYLLRKLA